MLGGVESGDAHQALIRKIYMGKEMQIYSKNPANKPRSLNPGAFALDLLSSFAVFSKKIFKNNQIIFFQVTGIKVLQI